MNKLKAIKIIVFVLTFLLILGTLTALSLVVKKSKPKTTLLNKEVFLKEPYGSQINGISHNNNNTYLLIKDGGKKDRIIILDPSNNIISKINLGEQSNEQ